MKKVILFLSLLVVVTATFSQQTAAWILMEGGVLSTVLGLAGSGVNPDYGDGGLNTSGGAVFLVTGLAAIVASIPFLSLHQRTN